jgi:hypothetical protein
VPSATSIEVPEGTVKLLLAWLEVFVPFWATCCSLHPERPAAATSATMKIQFA